MFGLRLGKLGAALKAGSGSVGVTPLFSRDYEATGSLGADATFTRSSSATIVDHEGVIRTVPSGAARFNGLRYVRNLFTNTTTSLASGSSTTAVTVTAGSYIFSMGAGSGTATFSGTATGSTGTLSANASNRTAKTLTITAGGTIIVTASVAALATIQLENATGRTDTTTPSEYVSVGVLSSPYHGAGVDGIKYFATENGNSVVGNVVTEGTGAAIEGGALLLEPAATNISNWFSTINGTTYNTNSNISFTENDAVAPDGTTAATRLTAIATGSSIYAAETSPGSSAVYTYSAFVKRGNCDWVTTGLWSGGIDYIAWFNLASGVVGTQTNCTASIVAAGDGWYRVTLTTSNAMTLNLVNAPVPRNADGVLSTTGGYYCFTWGISVESGTTATSPIPTSGTAVTRAAESLSYSGIAADNETRAITDAGTVDVDDWDGIVDATINGADNLAQITSIDVYTTGERPA